MRHRLKRIPGTPFRIRSRERPFEGPAPEDDSHGGGADDDVPMKVRIRVAGGRSPTASALRAARVLLGMKEVGAVGRAVAMGGGLVTLDGELDRAQLEHVRNLPLVLDVRPV